MHHSRRKSRRFIYRTGGFIVLLWAAHGSIFSISLYRKAIGQPGGAPRESSTKRRSDPKRIGSHRAFQSFSSCIFCRSSSSRTRHLPSAGGARSPRRRRTGAERPARAAESRRTRSCRSRRGAEKENAPSGHEAFKAFCDGGFNDDLRHVSSSVKHNGMVLSRVAPLYTLERKCKSYQSMRKRTKRRRSVHFFLTG